MRFSIHNLVRAQPPLTLEQLADYWAKKNVDAIAEIALRSMMDPVGTAYDVPPLRIVGFETPDARILYQLRLHDAARAASRKNVVEHAITQHIEELVCFCRAQFLTALTGEPVHGIFQPDEFNVRCYAGAR